MPFTGWSCSVCSDGLHKDVGGTDVPTTTFLGANIMVTPCGHAFHSYCITRWLMGLPGPNGTCPNCRKLIPRKHCTPTYPDTYDITFSESDLISTQSSSSSQDYKQECDQVKKLLLDEKKKTASLKTELADLKALSESFRQDGISFEAAYRKEQESSNNYRTKYEIAKSYETLVIEKENELKKLKNEMNKYKWVKNLIQEHKAEVDSEMETMTFDPEHFRNIIECNKLLQRELQTTSAAVQKEKKERELDNKRIANFKKEISQLKKEIIELKSVVDDVNEQLAAKRGVTHATSTPKLTIRSKRNNKALEDLDRTIDLSSDDEKSEKPKTDLTKKKKLGVGTSTGTWMMGKRVRDLSPLGMKIRSNIPGIGPITPTPSTARPTAKAVRALPTRTQSTALRAKTTKLTTKPISTAE